MLRYIVWEHEVRSNPQASAVKTFCPQHHNIKFIFNKAGGKMCIRDRFIDIPVLSELGQELLLAVDAGLQLPYGVSQLLRVFIHRHSIWLFDTSSEPSHDDGLPLGFSLVLFL